MMGKARNEVQLSLIHLKLELALSYKLYFKIERRYLCYQYNK